MPTGQPQILQTAKAIVGWYRANARPLPWRQNPQPYAVLVSELMLQQTQVETALPYFGRWMARFPNPASLAQAPLEEALKLWEGLGYYARCRNLHRAAQQMAAHHGGQVPFNHEALRSLPGVGPYTAGAVASIAFGQPAALVDGNVARLLSRRFGVAAHLAQKEGHRQYWGLAQRLVEAADPSALNQGMMELGALVCRPRAPRCAGCPLQENCVALRLGQPEAYPPPKPRAAQPEVLAALALVQAPQGWLLRQRPPGGLWGGLYEPPWVEQQPNETPEQAAARLLTGLALAGPPSPAGRLRHTLTHRRFVFHCLVGRASKAAGTAPLPDGWLWASPQQLARLPLARHAQKALRAALETP